MDPVSKPARFLLSAVCLLLSIGCCAQAQEKIVAIPMAVLALTLLSLVNFGTQSGQLGFGFIGVWNSGQMSAILILSLLLFVISVFSILILIDRRENTFCIPIERSSSILAGIAAAYVLARLSLGAAPTPAETSGALLLIAAILLLSIGPRLVK